MRLRDLKPDIVMSSAFVGDVSFVEDIGDEWAQAIDDNVSRLLQRVLTTKFSRFLAC